MHLARPIATRAALLVLCLLMGATACRPREPEAPPRTVTQVTGTTAERIAKVVATLRLPDTLRSTVLDAHALQEQVGDGRIGPSDFTNFVILRVSPRDMALWQAQLTEPLTKDDMPMFAEPTVPASWWVKAPEFPTLTLYDASAMTGRTNGWIGVNAASGAIYIYTFTL